MKWYNDKRADEGIVISSRIRLARNLSELPFPSKCTDEQQKTVCTEIKAALEKNACERFNYIAMSSLSPVEKSLLVEDHLASPDFCEGRSSGKMLITDEQSTASVMINEEDHLRIQSVTPGLDLIGAYKRASDIDDAISAGVKIAYDREFGYLTACPTNLGTGMRASVMLHLPALTHLGKISSVMNLMTKIGLTVRGLYGEGSAADGCLYQISNQITLGISEKDAIEKLTSAVNRIAEQEKSLREALLSEGGVDFEDSICRSFGILKYARKLSSGEFLKLWSDVKFGIDTGVITELSGVNLTRLLIEVMPAHLMQKYEGLEKPSARDIKRAEIIRGCF